MWRSLTTITSITCTTVICAASTKAAWTSAGPPDITSMPVMTTSTVRAAGMWRSRTATTGTVRTTATVMRLTTVTGMTADPFSRRLKGAGRSPGV